ncbi:MAG: L-threonylcarbamoyladenylate synthase [Minisyncoccia bacterium]
MQKNIWNNENLIKILKNGGVAIIPTDTVYGFVVSAFSSSAIEHLYSVRKPTSNKPCILLIGDVSEINKFDITPTPEQEKVIKNYWPGPVTIIFDCPSESFRELHRGTNTRSFRLPDSSSFREFLKKTGPLLAPSANTEGNPIAKNIQEAKNYFGNVVDIYIDGGEIAGKPSKIIKLHKDGSATVLRE